MAPPRKWDHDEGLRLFRGGMSISQIARLLGAADASVRRVCDPAYRQRCLESTRRSGKSAACIDCWATIWRHGRNNRCTSCHNKSRMKRTRPTELQCYVCERWQPDESFAHQVGATWRRQRHSTCRACQAKVRRDHRRRNREADNAYNRAYKARRRAEARRAA